jgi:hypothetical protein
VHPKLLRAGRAVVLGLRSATSRIESPRFWRPVYALLATPAATRLAHRVAGSFGDAEDVLERLSHLFLTGWPHHGGTPWINLNVLRFATEAKRMHAQPVAPRAPSAGRRLRVGLLANLRSTLTFSPAFFTSAPSEVELVVFDLAGRGTPAGYLEQHVTEHLALERTATDEIVAAIERTRPDLLLVDVYKSDVYGILDGITVPCVVDVGTTVQARFHPNVAFRLYCLQQADYLTVDGRLFCATSESLLDDTLVVPGTLLFDARGLDARRRAPWAEREPLLVFHNKLYKASDSYLDAVFRSLLAEDSSLEFVAFGRDSDGALARIEAAARRYGVADRVHYEGEFSPLRDDQGRIADEGWLRVAELLGRARLAPDPWPLGGASSRVEAYAAGAPVVHMGIRVDRGSWRRPQPAVTADHPGLEVPALTAHTPAEYVSIARRLLEDAELADAAAAEQAALAARVTDGASFWSQILDGYVEWLAKTGSTSVSSERGL